MLKQSTYFRILIVAIASIALLAPGSMTTSLMVSPETLKTAWGVAGVCVFLLLWVFTHSINFNISIVRTPFYYPILGFLLWSIVSLGWVVDNYLATVILVQFISVSLAFFIVINSIHSEKQVKQLLFCLVIASMLVSILGLLQYYFPNNSAIQRFVHQSIKPASTFGNTNMAVHYIVITLPLSIAFLLRVKSLPFVVFFTLSTVICGWFLIHSHTRAGWLSISVELLLLVLFLVYDYIKNKQNPFLLNSLKSSPLLVFTCTVVGFIVAFIMAYFQSGWLRYLFSIMTMFMLALALLSCFKWDSKPFVRFHKAIIILVGFVLWFGAINTTPEGFKNNISGISSEFRGITAGQFAYDGNSRIAAWRNTLEMIHEHLLIGVGIGQWPAYYPLFYDRVVKDTIFNESVRLRHLHNEYLELLADFGVVGVVILFWLVSLIMYTAYQLLANHQSENRYLILGVVLALSGFAVTSMFSFPIKAYTPLLIAMIFIALIANIYSRRGSDSHQK